MKNLSISVFLCFMASAAFSQDTYYYMVANITQTNDRQTDSEYRSFYSISTLKNDPAFADLVPYNNRVFGSNDTAICFYHEGCKSKTKMYNYFLTLPDALNFLLERGFELFTIAPEIKSSSSANKDGLLTDVSVYSVNQYIFRKKAVK